jgi:hypothetical protein
MYPYFSIQSFDTALGLLDSAIKNAESEAEKKRLSKLARQVSARKAEVLAEQLLSSEARFE